MKTESAVLPLHFYSFLTVKSLIKYSLPSDAILPAITGGPVRTYPSPVQPCHSKAIFYLLPYLPFSAIRDSLSYFYRYTLFFNVFSFALLNYHSLFELSTFSQRQTLTILQKNHPVLLRSLRKNLHPQQLLLRSLNIFSLLLCP